MLALAGMQAPAFALQRSGADTNSDQRDWLVQQVRAGLGSGRAALIDDALARLQRLAPNAPGTLLASLEVQLYRQQSTQAASTLQRLRTSAPASAELASAERLWRAHQGAQRSALQQARLLATAGRSDQALAVYRRLFGDQPPGLQLGIEYWRLRSSQPQGRSLALARITALDRAYPGNVELQQLRSQLLFSAQRDAEGLQVLRDIGTVPGARDLAVQSEWNRLADMGPNATTLQRLRDFVARYPTAPQAGDARKRIEDVERVLNDPGHKAALRAQGLLDAGKPAHAEAAFRQALRHRPRDPALVGGLGQALLRQDRREQALARFREAVALAPRGDDSGKWRSLAASTEFWLQLSKADAALEAGDHARAQGLYAAAHRRQPGEVNAVLGLANVALARGDDAEAERRLLQARRIEPQNRAATGKLVQLYARTEPERMEAFVAGLPAAERTHYADDLRRVRLDRLKADVEAARIAGRLDEAIAGGQALQRELPDDPWIAYRLANDLKTADRVGDARAVIADMVLNAGTAPAARYAQALFLASIDRPAEALAALAQAPQAEWNEDMRGLAARLEREQLMAQLRSLRASGNEAQAIALLRQQPASLENRLMLAEWARERDDWRDALAIYDEILAAQPDHPEAALGRVESWIALGDAQSARRALQQSPPILAEDDTSRQRRLAAIWGELGETDQQWALLKPLIARKTAPDAQLYRDAARARRMHAPAEALDVYALAMQDAGLLDAGAARPRDDRALTRASRERASDDWLLRSLRSDVETFYQARNPTLTVMQDSGRRNDGTPGFSRLTRDTRLVDYRQPFAGGYGWARLEQVRMDAGRFRTNAGGGFDADFGTCALSLLDPTGTPVAAPDCIGGVHQRLSTGVGLALGWRNARDNFAFDLGRSPAGQPVGNWLGGVSFSGDLGKLGWSLTASRRPMTNSLLSQFGAVDPRSGIRWGGVTANGLTFGLGYDQGGRNGFWSSWGWHRIVGRNVQDNTRLRAMAGWYHKWMQRPDLRIDVGVTAMAWGYRRDLGGYSLGQGGYYSPQRYASLSLPVSLAWRSDDWSLRLDGSVGYSHARTDDGNRYPLPALVQPVAAAIAAASGQPLLFDNRISRTRGGSSHGGGYRVTAALERRLGDHWVAGLGATLQRSRDFSPNTFQFYLRYTGLPWQGNLPMPVSPLVPYGEFR